MALNIAVPLSGVGGLSPISPIGLDCWEQIKMLVSPIGSESSGVSSLDSEEAKQQSLQSTPPDTPEEFEIKYYGRDILDLGANINPDKWTMRYTYLPENNNMPMYLANRSQYHRLGPNGHIQDYSLVKCEHCDFQYPINSGNSYFCRTSVTVSPTTTSTMTYSRPPMFNRHSQSNLLQHQQQQQQSQQSLPPLQNSLYQSNNSNYNNINNNNMYGNNQMNSNSFLKKTSASTISTAASCTFSSASSSASSFASSSPTSSISSGYGSSSSINNGNYNNFGVGGLNRYPQQQSPPHNSNSLFMNNSNTSNNASNMKSAMPSNTFNNFGSFLNAFSNNSANNNNNNNNSNNGYINQTQLNSVSQQQQPSYVGVYNYFS